MEGKKKMGMLDRWMDGNKGAKGGREEGMEGGRRAFCTQ